MRSNYGMFYKYLVNCDGEVYSCLRPRATKMTPTIKKGRLYIRLSDTITTGKTYFSLARVVYSAFNEDFDITDRDMCITFKNGDKLDVRIDNLECVFRGDLIQGEGHKAVAKLTTKEVNDIKMLYFSTRHNRPVNQHDNVLPYNSYRMLGKRYGVPSSLIRDIVKGKIWNKDNYKLRKEG